MPLGGRTPLSIAQLAFGVTPTDDPRFTRPFDNAGPSGFSMGGSPSRSNELLIDGAPDTTGDSRVAYNPSKQHAGFTSNRVRRLWDSCCSCADRRCG
jgi:hypothetical protein